MHKNLLVATALLLTVPGGMGSAPWGAELGAGGRDQDLVPPLGPPPGALCLPAQPVWVSKCGDAMYGNLAMGSNAIVLNNQALLSQGTDWLQFNGKTVCLVNDAGCGSVRRVDSGAGLTGGPITDTGTLSVAVNGITSAMLQDASVTGTKLAAGSVTSAKLAGGAVGAAQVNASAVQLRVAGTCGAGNYVRVIAQDGTVTCGADGNSGGTVTSVASGAGLAGGPITTSGTLSIAMSGVTGAMVADGDVTGVDIADGSIGGIDVNDAQVQRRVSGTCAFPQSLSAVAQDGSVTCRNDRTPFARASSGFGGAIGPCSSPTNMLNITWPTPGIELVVIDANAYLEINHTQGTRDEVRLELRPDTQGCGGTEGFQGGSTVAAGMPTDKYRFNVKLTRLYTSTQAPAGKVNLMAWMDAGQDGGDQMMVGSLVAVAYPTFTGAT